MIIPNIDKLKKIQSEEGADLLASLQMSRYYETYIKLSKARFIFITENFTKEMAAAITALLIHYDHEAQDEDITIYINSDGGDAAALTNIYDVVKMITAPVSTVCFGKAYSAGAFLLCAGAKGKRYALEHTEIMLHSVQTIMPAFGSEHPIDSKNYLEFLNDTNDGIMKILADNTGHTLEKVKKDCERDFYLTAKEAQVYGLIDKVWQA